MPCTRVRKNIIHQTFLRNFHHSTLPRSSEILVISFSWYQSIKGNTFQELKQTYHDSAREKEKEHQEIFAKGYRDPYFQSTSDSFNTPIGSIIFNGDNYQNWSRSVRMALGAKNKLGFIDGTLKKPAPDHSNYHKWIRNDNMVRCWLFASVSVEIANIMIYMNTARQFWDEIKERYGQTNAPLLYKLKKDLNDLRKESKLVTECYCKIKNLWDEITSIEGVLKCICGAMAKCTCNILKKLHDADALNKLIQFLMALNETFDNMKGNILAMEPLPPVNRAFHLVQQLEKQKEIAGILSTVPEMSALTVNIGN
ncbi:Retrovirus-related Pol polyprotein from transposon RE1 [Bienertia sinuspersici]